MAKDRPQKTPADYVAIALGPILIMLLVGSLMFFLLDVIYTGQHAGRMRWILFWFVLAAVLIERIRIEQGSQTAYAYAAFFWAAVALVVFKFVPDAALVALGLLAVGWWCAGKLTFDCTVIDEHADASGQGLLQVAGLDGAANPAATDSAVASGNPVATETDEDSETSKKKPHAPGTWVVYFSLAALPLFGFGQLLIPAAESARRASAFRMLWIYVAAGVGLLLTTSFLGLRRYLRQRRLPMPAGVTRSWLSSGVILAAAVLFFTLILPRPDSAYSLNNVVDDVAESVGKASDWAFGSEDDAGEGDGRHAGREAEDGEHADGGSKGKDGQQTGDVKSSKTAGGGDGKRDGNSDNKQGGKQGKSGKQKSGEKPAGQDDKSQQKSAADDDAEGKGESGESQQNDSGETQQEQTTSGNMSEAGKWVATLFRWIVYGLLIIAAVIALLFYRRQVWQGIVTFFRDLLAFFRTLFGGAAKTRQANATSSSGTPSTTSVPARPFSSYPNPFDTGQARSMPRDELVRYTFGALEAWAREAGVPRREDQTALEFAAQLRRQHSELGSPAAALAQVYTRLAYSQQLPPDNADAVAADVWQTLSRLPRPDLATV